MTTESALTSIPENTSLLQPTKFTFVVPDLPFATYFCQEANIPGISTNPVEQPNPFTSVWRHGDKPVWGDLSLTVLVDEDLRVWEETFNWIVSYVKPTDFAEYRNRNGQQRSPVYHDGVLTINTNANLPNLRILFKEIHPFSISPVTFDMTIPEAPVIRTTVLFKYDYFQFERMS